MKHIEVFSAPCCGGLAGQLNEMHLTNQMREIETKRKVKVTIHTLVFGDPESLKAVRQLTEYLRASGLERIADAGIFAILGVLPIISVDGIVRFVKNIPTQAELLAIIGEADPNEPIQT